MNSILSKVFVRQAEISDLSSLIWCSMSSATEEERRGFSEPVEERIFGSMENLTAAIKLRTFRIADASVAEVNGKVVGYVILESREDSIELVDIAVAGPFQKQGVGKKMVEFVEARTRAQGKSAVTLGSSRSATNIPWKSVGWWKHLGFRETAEERNEWTRSFGGSEIRMRKDL
jgi:ribosomal protein S18 acetylase RimI-like enzyme